MSPDSPHHPWPVERLEPGTHHMVVSWPIGLGNQPQLQVGNLEAHLSDVASSKSTLHKCQWPVEEMATSHSHVTVHMFSDFRFTPLKLMLLTIVCLLSSTVFNHLATLMLGYFCCLAVLFGPGHVVTCMYALAYDHCHVAVSQHPVPCPAHIPPIDQT